MKKEKITICNYLRKHTNNLQIQKSKKGTLLQIMQVQILLIVPNNFFKNNNHLIIKLKQIQ